MAHGGTNFGFFSGANTGQNASDYQSDITSYDYVKYFTWGSHVSEISSEVKS